MSVKSKKNPTQDCISYLNPSGKVIGGKEIVKDLGVFMSSDCFFNAHINKVEKSTRNLPSWILRTFQSRDQHLMMTVWKALVIPIHDYCSQLWSPCDKKNIKLLENVQWNFLKKIQGMHGKTYSEILQELNMYSLQRRRDRYRLIYCWKMLEGLVPSVNINCSWSDRRGRLLVPTRNILNHDDQKFSCFVVKAWNELPRTGIIPSTFLLPVYGSRNSIFN